MQCVFSMTKVSAALVRTDFQWGIWSLPVWPGSGSGPSPNKHKAPGPAFPFLLKQKNWVVATQRFFYSHPYLGKMMNPF